MPFLACSLISSFHSGNFLKYPTTFCCLFMFKEKGLEGWLKYGVKLGRMCGLLALPMAQQVKNLPAVQETQEMQVLSLVWESPLEEEMATCSSILAWGTTWTEDAGRLQSKGLPRVGHDWVAKHKHASHTDTHHTHTHMWQWHGAPLMSVFSKVHLRVCHNKLVNITKMKQSHKYGEQTSGYQGGRMEEGLYKDSGVRGTNY